MASGCAPPGLHRPAAVRSLVIACAAANDAGVLLDRAGQCRRRGMPGILETTLERWFLRHVRAVHGRSPPDDGPSTDAYGDEEDAR